MEWLFVMWATCGLVTLYIFFVKSVKFRYSEKATKFDEMSIFSKQRFFGGYFQTGFCKAFENFVNPIPQPKSVFVK